MQAKAYFKIKYRLVSEKKCHWLFSFFLIQNDKAAPSSIFLQPARAYPLCYWLLLTIDILDKGTCELNKLSPPIPKIGLCGVSLIPVSICFHVTYSCCKFFVIAWIPVSLGRPAIVTSNECTCSHALIQSGAICRGVFKGGIGPCSLPLW